MNINLKIRLSMVSNEKIPVRAIKRCVVNALQGLIIGNNKVKKVNIDECVKEGDKNEVL